MMILTPEDPHVVIRVPARDWRRNANGGDYDRIYYFTTRPDGLVEVEFGTSAEAEFDYCRKRGIFASCEDCLDWDHGDRN